MDVVVVVVVVVIELENEPIIMQDIDMKTTKFYHYQQQFALKNQRYLKLLHTSNKKGKFTS